MIFTKLWNASARQALIPKMGEVQIVGEQHSYKLSHYASHNMPSLRGYKRYICLFWNQVHMTNSNHQIMPAP